MFHLAYIVLLFSKYQILFSIVTITNNKKLEINADIKHTQKKKTNKKLQFSCQQLYLTTMHKEPSVKSFLNNTNDESRTFKRSWCLITE